MNLTISNDTNIEIGTKLVNIKTHRPVLTKIANIVEPAVATYLGY